MITIVGTKIIMKQGETDIFRILLRDAKGNEVALTDSDVITLRMKYVLESNSSLVKKATPTTVFLEDGSQQTYHLMHFTSSDTMNLLAGTYHYDLTLENQGKRYTVVPTSVLELEESILLDVDDIDDDVVVLETDNSIDYDSIMTYTPLVGSFPEVKFSEVNQISEVDDEIIIF